MATVISAGDVLQLCQQTWKLQHTFSDKPGIPPEFLDIERELTKLTKALSAISESLDEDQSLLLASNYATKQASIIILESCQRTLHELEILVASYQDVKKVVRPDGSRSIERQWRPIFIRNYLTTIWTNEGGDIHDLKNILSLHVQSMAFFYDSITSDNQKFLEFVLPPVAQDMQQIHSPYSGSEKAKLVEIRDDLDSISRRYKAFSDSVNYENGTILQLESSQFQYGANTSRPRADASREWLSGTPPPPVVPPRSPEREKSFSRSRDTVRRPSLRSTVTPRDLSPTSNPSRPMGSYRLRSNTSHSNASYSQSPVYDQHLQIPTGDSISNAIEQLEIESSQSRSNRTNSGDGSFIASVIPTAATSIGSPQADDPFHQVRMLGRTPPGEVPSSEGNEPAGHKLWRNTLLKHSAVLFDQKCSAVEYTKPNEKRIGDFLMETATGPCQLYLITKGVKSTTGTLRYHTSIWVLSEDGEVVMEQKLPDDMEVIPYTIWDNHTKIVLRVPADLRFYTQHPDDRPQRTVNTSWVNYIFADEPAATEFQNVLIGKKLLASIRTRKTTRIYSGMSGAFSNQQQLCALENLRIFRDDHNGLVYSMIHFVPEFSTGNGYMTFPLNDPKKPIRVKEDSSTAVKIKGMTMSIREGTRRASTSSDPSRASKKGQDVLITGAKLEFYSRDDKAFFMLKLKEVQDSGFLPDE